MSALRTGFRRILTGSLILAAGCGYPSVSRSTYDCATALYSVCNQRDATRLELVEQQIRAAEQAGDISGRETHWLNDIIVQARAEDWDSAAAEARRILTDQITAQ